MKFLEQFAPYSFPRLGLVRLPSLVITDEDKALVGVKSTASNVQFLKKLVWNEYQTMAAAGKFGTITEKEVIDRLKFEFEVLEKTGTTDYILLVWDINRWCDVNKIPRGPGRGSSCGSLVCFLSKITGVNPLIHNLNFTRFLSEARVKPKIIDGVIYADGKSICDIDCDYSVARRYEIQQYIDRKYPNRSSKISNITALTGKTALKDVLKVYLEYNEDQAKAVSDLIEVHFGKVEKLEKALETSKDYKAWVESDPSHLKAHNLAISIQGLLIHKGVHASGLFLSYDTLDNTLPVEITTDEDGIEFVTSSFDMEIVAEIGVKLDALNLKILDTIGETCILAGINRDDIDINHPSIYEFIAKSDLYYGIFQIEKGLTRDATFKAKPKDINQLSACLSIARPGSLAKIPNLVEYFHTGKIDLVYPPIDAILKDTANIIIYQESINEICQKVYGLSATDSDEIRRAISKKLRKDIEKWEPVLFLAGENRQIPKNVTEWFWTTCNNSADYLFSLNHALAYSYITAWTLYLKANYLKEFYLATLKFAKKEEMSIVIAEARKLGVNVLPPHLIKSEDNFKFEGNDIRFGLQHIKGIAGANLSKVTSFRREFTSKFEIFNFAKELGIPVNVLETLVLCGALDWPATNRVKLAMEARAYNLLLDSQKAIVSKLAKDYDYDLMDTLRALKDRKDEKGKPLLKEGPLATFRKKLGPYWNEYQNNIRNEDFTLYIVERNLLGFSYSNTLFNLFSKKVEGLIPVGEVAEEPKGVEVSFVAFVGEIKKGTGKQSKKPYQRYELTDESGTINGMISGQDRIQGCLEFNGKPVEEDMIVICHGIKGDGIVFIDSMIIQESPISVKSIKEEGNG